MGNNASVDVRVSENKGEILVSTTDSALLDRIADLVTGTPGAKRTIVRGTATFGEKPALKLELQLG